MPGSHRSKLDINMSEEKKKKAIEFNSSWATTFKLNKILLKNNHYNIFQIYIFPADLYG